MRAYCRFRLPDGQTADACPGDLIGRLWSAAIRLEDPRLSEAHALVSLRGNTLKLLALRGVLAVEGSRVTEVLLEAGLRVELATGLRLEVLEVELPETALALAGLAATPLILTASVHSVLPGPHLVPRYLADALAWLWSTGEGWTLQLPGEAPRPLASGDTFAVDDTRVQAVTVAGTAAGLPETRLRGRLHPPIRIVARYDSVQFHRDGEPVFVLGGTSARLLSELVAMGGLAGWEAIAGEVWPAETERVALRQRWDRNLQTLRRKIREARLRPDLVRADGKGHLELVLLDGDVVDDQV